MRNVRSVLVALLGSLGMRVNDLGNNPEWFRGGRGRDRLVVPTSLTTNQRIGDINSATQQRASAAAGERLCAM